MCSTVLPHRGPYGPQYLPLDLTRKRMRTHVQDSEDHPYIHVSSIYSIVSTYTLEDYRYRYITDMSWWNHLKTRSSDSTSSMIFSLWISHCRMLIMERIGQLASISSRVAIYTSMRMASAYSLRTLHIASVTGKAY